MLPSAFKAIKAIPHIIFAEDADGISAGTGKRE